MEKVNHRFYDEYTRLDNLCKQMFNSDKGVTDYIESMKNTPRNKSSKIKDWDSDLKMLKQYRHIRNYLAHTTGAFHQDVCLPYDVTWMKMFSSRIMKQKDPLSMLFKLSNDAPKKKTAGSQKKSKNNRSSARKNSRKLAVLPLCIAVIAVLVIIFILTKG